MVIKTQIPLLKDHHSHPFMFAVLSNCINLAQAPTKQQALSMMENTPEEINVILGWNNCWYSFEEEELDQLPPFIICNNAFHRFLINQPTRQKLAISHQDVLTYINDQGWVERNLSKIMNLILAIKPYHLEQITAFYHYLLQQGVWYLEDMSLPNEKVIHLFEQLGYLERTRFWAEKEIFDSLTKETQRDICGIKIFIDGALGSETAALKAPYLSGKQGVLVYSDQELQAMINQVAEINKAIAFHAIGDQAISQVITVLTQIKAEQGAIPPTRIEHSQFISRHDAQRAKALGIILSMQPNFNMNSIQYQDRLPEKYWIQNNPFRMLIDEIGFVPGKDLIFGSDAIPRNPSNVLECALFPPFPTLDEFVQGYCLPDKKPGYIEVTIDEEKQYVSTAVKIESC